MNKSVIKNKKIFVAALFYVLQLLPITYYLLPGASALSFWDNKPNEQLAREIVEEMTPTELYSQILMFGWAGAEPEQILYDWVARGLGSVKVFGWNTDDIYLVAKSITSLQTSASKNRFQIPLFVATDQEGGWIRHVKGDTSITPGNMAIGASGYPSDSYYSAYYISKEIKVLGINMNFAPTVDLYTNHDSTIISSRSFGEDPVKSGILGAAWAKGSMSAGVIPTVKHFPGHGDTENDSHGTLPKIDVDFATFANRELVPFRYLIDAGVPAVMSGHLSFPKIDPTGTPASLSKYFLTDLLRGQLGYNGLIITDDMMMNGATMFAGSLSSAFRQAIQAGNDIIISSTCAKLNENLWTSNLNLIGTDPEFRARVEDAAYRVIKAKLEYFKGGNAAPLYPDASVIDEAIPDKEGEKFFLEQACRSITVFEGKGSLPKNEAGRVLLVGGLPEFFTSMKRRYPDAGEFRFQYETGPNQTQWVIDNLSGTAASYDTIVLLVGTERHARIAESLKKLGKKVVICSIMYPVYSERLTWTDTVLMGYSWSGYTLEAMAALLAGEYEAEAILPFTKN